VRGVLTPDAARFLAQRLRLQHPEKAQRDVLRVLEHDGYLVVDEEAGGWVFVSPLIRDWWGQRFGKSYISPGEEG